LIIYSCPPINENLRGLPRPSAVDDLREAMFVKMSDDLNVQPIDDLLILKRFSGQAVDEIDPLLAQV